MKQYKLIIKYVTEIRKGFRVNHVFSGIVNNDDLNNHLQNLGYDSSCCDSLELGIQEIM